LPRQPAGLFDGRLHYTFGHGDAAAELAELYWLYFHREHGRSEAAWILASGHADSYRFKAEGSATAPLPLGSSMWEAQCSSVPAWEPITVNLTLACLPCASHAPPALESTTNGSGCALLGEIHAMAGSEPRPRES
jgi:hypothetical protein